MVKKEYVKPEMVMEEFISEIYMLGGSNGNEIPVLPEEGDEGDFDANDRRGGWGDLWN